jgi:hypothetical protein
MNYGENLESWFFIYQGYSFVEKKAYAFVKWADSENFLVWENLYHQLPDRVTLWLGKDPFYPAFNGDLKLWKLNFGPGAYRTTGFEELYQLETPPIF